MKRMCMVFVSSILGIGLSLSLTIVEIEGFSFNPDDITIPVGETVRWVNLDTAIHTSTSDTSVWDSGNLGQGDTYEFTFNVSPGDYSYHCEVHPSMTAVVHLTESTIETQSLGKIKSLMSE